MIQNRASILNRHSEIIANGATWTGEWESVAAFPAIVVACKTDQSGALFVDFSPDGVNVDSTFPASGFLVSANVNEVHRVTVTRAFYRIRFTNDSGASQTFFRLTTLMGDYQNLNAPLNTNISDDADSIITRSLAIGKQPDGDYVTDVADGLVFQNSTTLGASATFTSDWYDSDGFTTVELFVKTGKISQLQGLVIEYTDDVQGAQTVRGSKRFTFLQSDVDRGFKELHVATVLDGFRIKYTNGTVAQSAFFISCTLRKATDNNFYNTGRALIVADFNAEVSLGNVSNYLGDTKFGRNPDIGTATTPEDIWNGGSVYTGQPRNYTPQTIQIFSSSTADTNISGTGAWTIRVVGLKTSTSTFYEFEDFNLNGTTIVTSASTWWRVNRSVILTAGTGRQNAGQITIRASTTTTNVFAVMPIGYNKTAICAFTVPFGQKCLVQHIGGGITRSGGTAGSATIIFRARPSGGVFNAERIYDVTTSTRIDDDDYLLLAPLTDVKMSVEFVSDNSTIAQGAFRYLLLEQD